jgi:hypothetical protein
LENHTWLVRLAFLYTVEEEKGEGRAMFLAHTTVSVDEVQRSEQKLFGKQRA